MKKLILRRVDTPNGPNDAISSQTLALAQRQGELAEAVDRPTKIFHGPLAQSEQPARAYHRGLGLKGEAIIMPIVEDLGNRALFLEIATPTYKEHRRTMDLSVFTTFLLAHSRDDYKMIHKVMRLGRQAVSLMFSKMKEGEIGAAFCPSPILETTASFFKDDADGIKDLGKLNIMEGLVLIDDGDSVRVTEKVSVPKEVMA
jgi:hypothetical protein